MLHSSLGGFLTACALALALMTPPFAVWYIRHRRAPIVHSRLLLTLALIGDVLVTLILTLFRWSHDSFLQPIPFATWYEAWITQTQYSQLLLNIAVFIPFGALIAARFPRLRSLHASALLSLGFSLFIEIAQLITARGVGDVDDLFCNTLGGLLGASCVCFVTHWQRGARRDALRALLPVPITAAALILFLVTSLALH